MLSITIKISIAFGGSLRSNVLPLSERFDLDENRWIKFTPMPKADFKCHSAIFNGNILISGWKKKNILLYSIDLNSFSIIPYDFEKYKRKILINIWRLYLIECDGFVYESEIGDEYAWKQIAKSIINFEHWQVYCSYNKGGIYITANLNDRYYKFDLDQKIMVKL